MNWSVRVLFVVAAAQLVVASGSAFAQYDNDGGTYKDGLKTAGSMPFASNVSHNALGTYFTLAPGQTSGSMIGVVVEPASTDRLRTVAFNYSAASAANINVVLYDDPDPADGSPGTRYSLGAPRASTVSGYNGMVDLTTVPGLPVLTRARIGFELTAQVAGNGATIAPLI